MLGKLAAVAAAAAAAAASADEDTADDVVSEFISRSWLSMLSELKYDRLMDMNWNFISSSVCENMADS